MITLHCNLCGFVPGRTGGAQVFLEGMLREFELFDELDICVYGSTNTQQWLASFLARDFRFNVVGKDSAGILNRFLATRKLRSVPNAGEILWSPLNQGVGASGATEVLTIHDLIPLHYSQARPEYKPSWKRRLAFSVRWRNSKKTALKSSAVVTVSKSNVDLLQAALGVGSPTVYGAPNGIDPNKQKAALEKSWSYSGEPTVLAVTSGSMPHKGIRTLEKVAQLLPDVTFSIVGKGTSASQPNIVHTGKLSVFELNELYRNSSALFFPSRIEGFGLPVLEALVFGTPVVASDLPVLREVGGEATRYFKLDDIEAAAHQLQTVITSQTTAEAMSIAGLEHSRQFTWANAAAVYREVFRSIKNKTASL